MLERLAIDRQSMRSYSVDGHLHVALCRVSKANVCEYYGSEIPDAETLGLRSDKLYRLYRDPEELAAAAQTLNGKPLLDTHVYTNAEEHRSDRTVGAMGTDAQFVAPYLLCSIAVWDQGAIDGIESGQQRELSCSYHYRADMTPGTTTDGIAFDGRMLDVVFNHCALVEKGRAGADVVVGDSAMKVTSVQALMVGTALQTLARPHLATGKVLALDAALKDVNAGNYKAKAKAIAKAVLADAKDKLAADAELTMEDVVDVIQAVQGVDPDDDDMTASDEDETEEEKKEREAKEKAAKDKKAKDAEEDEKKEPKAMDSDAVAKAIKTASDAARTEAIATMNAIATAKEEVRPRVGSLTTAFDSAAAVYKVALDHAEVDLTGVPEVAYGALFRALPAPAAAPARHVAMDAAAVTEMSAMFPNATRLLN